MLITTITSAAFAISSTAIAVSTTAIVAIAIASRVFRTACPAAPSTFRVASNFGLTLVLQSSTFACSPSSLAVSSNPLAASSLAASTLPTAGIRVILTSLR